MKHCQLLYALEKAGFHHNGLHYLQLYEIIAALQGHPKHQIPNEWLERYFLYLDKAAGLPILLGDLHFASLTVEWIG